MLCCRVVLLLVLPAVRIFSLLPGTRLRLLRVQSLLSMFSILVFLVFCGVAVLPVLVLFCRGIFLLVCRLLVLVFQILEGLFGARFLKNFFVYISCAWLSSDFFISPAFS